MELMIVVEQYWKTYLKFIRTVRSSIQGLYSLKLKVSKERVWDQTRHLFTEKFEFQHRKQTLIHSVLNDLTIKVVTQGWKLFFAQSYLYLGKLFFWLRRYWEKSKLQLLTNVFFGKFYQLWLFWTIRSLILYSKRPVSRSKPSEQMWLICLRASWKTKTSI